jgi:hypothetical protein
VPEVGLELHSRPFKYWEPAKTCGIRAGPAPVSASLRPKVWTMSTGQNIASEASANEFLHLELEALVEVLAPVVASCLPKVILTRNAERWRRDSFW